MTDTLAIFFMGVGAGALALWIPWLGPSFKRYIVNCGKLSHQCPHHGPSNDKTLARSNDNNRNGPPRPPLK